MRQIEEVKSIFKKTNMKTSSLGINQMLPLQSMTLKELSWVVLLQDSGFTGNICAQWMLSN